MPEASGLKPLAVAVSGGADSMALLRLCAGLGRPVTALTVDHGLRKESAEEAQRVGAWCRDLGIAHEVLRWQPPSTCHNVQAAARKARYALMEEWCVRHTTPLLLVAHHLDDQVETMIERLMRGSGAYGMAGMSAMRPLREGVLLLRPLLSTPRTVLVDYLRRLGQEWIEDPSNQTEHFTRVRIRNSLKALSSKENLYELVGLLGALRAHKSAAYVDFIRRHVEFHAEGFCSLSAQALAAAPPETAAFVLGWLAQALGEKTYAPRWAELDALRQKISGGRLARTSLGGCLWQMSRKKTQPDTLVVMREPAHVAGATPVKYGSKTLWDGRFALDVPEHAAYRGAVVRALGSEAKSRFSLRNPGLSACVFSTLPSLSSLETLLAVPHIGYYARPELPRVSVDTTFAESLAQVPFISMLRAYGEKADAEYGT